MSDRIRYQLQHYDRPDGTTGTRVHFPAKRMTVDLGAVTDADLPAAIEGAHSLPGPLEVHEWEASEEAKRAQEAGEASVEDIVAGWYAQGSDGQR